MKNECLERLEEWKKIILKSQPNAYNESPEYMRMLDNDIKMAKECDCKNGTVIQR